MLAAAGLLAQHQAERLPDAHDGRPILITDPEVTTACLAGRAVVLVLEHFTAVPGDSGASCASTHDTSAGRRFNWAVVRSMCLERLSLDVPRELHLSALAGDPHAVSDILHHASLVVNGGAFGHRSHEQQALRARALLEPLQQQTALMALVISQQQQQWQAAQRVREVATFHRQQLVDCQEEELEMRARLEHAWRWDRSVFFPELATLFDVWRGSRTAIERQAWRRFDEARRAHDEAIGPLAFCNFKRLARLSVEQQEEQGRAFLRHDESSGWSVILAAHATWGVEEEARSAVEELEAANWDDLMRRVVCYFETLVGLDSERIREAARREVLQGHFDRELRKLRAEAVRLVPHALIARRRELNEQQLKQPSQATTSRARAAKEAMFWGPIRRDRNDATRAADAAGRPVGFVRPTDSPDGSSIVVDGNTATVRSEDTRRIAGSTGSSVRRVFAKHGASSGLRPGIVAPAPAALNHLVNAAALEEERRAGIATPPDPPVTPVPGSGRSAGPASDIGDPENRVRYHRAHLPRTEHRKVAVFQAFMRAKAAFRSRMLRFFRLHFQSIRLVQRRVTFVALEYPALVKQRQAQVHAMLSDGVTYNRSLARLAFHGDANQSNTPVGQLLLSATLKKTSGRCQRCVPLLLATLGSMARWQKDIRTAVLVVQHDREADILRWDAMLCGACSSHFLQVLAIDPATEHRHSMKKLIACGVSPIPDEVKALSDLADITARVEDCFPVLSHANRPATLLSVSVVQALLMQRRSVMLASQRSLQRLTRTVRYDLGANASVVLAQAKWRMRLMRRRSEERGETAPCRCATMLDMLTRRLDATLEHRVAVDVAKRLKRTKVMNIDVVARRYEPWILHHCSTYTAVDAPDALEPELMYVDPECARVRDRYHVLLGDWRRGFQYGLWVYLRLRFLVYLRRRRADYVSGSRHVCRVVQSISSPDVLELLSTRLRSAPSIAVATTGRRMIEWEKYRQLVNRNCSTCSARWSELRRWATDYCALAAFVRLRFQFVVRMRNMGAEERARLASGPFVMRDDWMLDRRCALFLQTLRLHLTSNPRLCEARIADYARNVCANCAGPLRVFVKPFIEARRAAIFLQARQRWRRLWRRAVGAMARVWLVSATRGGCPRCEAVLHFLRRRLHHTAASAQPLRQAEAAAYQAIMCRDRCRRTCEKVLQEGTATLERMRLAHVAVADLDGLDRLPYPHRRSELEARPWPERLALHRQSFDSALSLSTVQAVLHWQQSRQVAAFLKRAQPAAKSSTAPAAPGQRGSATHGSITADFAKAAHDLQTEDAIGALQDPTAAARKKQPAADAFLKTRPNACGESRTNKMTGTAPSPSPDPAPLGAGSSASDPPSGAPAQAGPFCLECGAQAPSNLDEWCRVCGEWIRKPTVKPFGGMSPGAAEAPRPDETAELANQPRSGPPRRVRKTTNRVKPVPHAVPTAMQRFL